MLRNVCVYNGFYRGTLRSMESTEFCVLQLCSGHLDRILIADRVWTARVLKHVRFTEHKCLRRLNEERV